MKHKFLLKTMLLLSALIAGSGNVWADDTYIKVTSSSQVTSGSQVIFVCEGNNQAMTSSSNYPGTDVTISNSTITLSSTSTVCVLTVGGSDNAYTFTYGTNTQLSWAKNGFSTNQTSNNKNLWTIATDGSFTCNVENSVSDASTRKQVRHNTNNTNKFGCYTSSTGKAVCLYVKQVNTNEPSITASDVNIAYDATSGSITYTIDNAVDGGAVTSATVTSSTPSGWLTVNGSNPYTSPISLSCEANATAASKTATVHLTYTYNTDETVTKDVTVTQAGNPNVVDNIEDISALNTSYTVKGTVVATNSRGFVIGDGTGYVYTYLNSAPSQSVGDIVKISGTTGTYGHILQFTSSATITTESTSSYDGTPAVATIDATAISDYNSDYQLSDYVQFEGTLSYSSSNYIISDNESSIRISYPTTAQTTALSALVDKTVRVKGYFAGFSSSTFTLMLESVEEVTYPTITTESSLAVPNYVVGTAEPEYETLTVNGSNLTDDITLSLGASSNFEMSTDLSSWTNTLTLTQSAGSVTDEEVAVRLKAGLSKGDYDGTLTLSSTGATNVNVSLSGSVTGQTYAINIDDKVIGGTIEADLASAEEGATVTLTATPDAAYTFGSWTVYEDDLSTEVTVTNNQFTMPDCEVYVTATFTAKPTYAITCTASPVAGGTVSASPTSAYEGQEVTLTCTPNSGYTLSSVVITKTSDGSATGISLTNNQFTMPGYAVTATATFVSNTFEGTFVQYSGDLTEGDYILVYNNKAMRSEIYNSNKFNFTSVTPVNNTISNPLRSIVWHIAPSSTDGYWTIYNAKEDKYANGTSSSTNVSLGDNPEANTAIWSVSGTFDFRCNANESQGTARYLRYYNSAFGNYAAGNGGALTLYKYTVLTERTITFNGNGGTYNEATTYTQEVYDGVEATLGANQFTRDGYAFVGWNNQADGEGDKTYGNEDNITVSGDNLTLYAQWAPLYTLTIDNNISGGSVSVEGDITSAIEGTEITLTNTATAGYTFSAWNVYKEGDTDTKVSVTDNKFNMPAYNVVISATFAEAQTYSLITDASNIVSGKHYIIANGTDDAVKAMGEQTTNNRASVDVTATSGIIPETTGIYEFVIYGPDANGYYTIYDEANSKYLYAASSSNNYLRTRDTNTDANGKWTIEINNTGIATIKAKGDNTRNWMRNNGNIFSCYGSGQSDIYLYVKDGDAAVATTESVTLNSYGYATYATTSALDFLDADAENVGYSAWQITDANSSTGVITFGQIKETVAAGKGILLKGTPGTTVNLNILPVGGATLGSNILVGTTTSVPLSKDGEAYGLSGNKFVKNSGAGDIPANRAYIPAASLSSDVKAFTFVFDDEDDPTSILTIDNGQQTTDGAIYNVAGQRIQKMQKGINIVNGKKILK